MSSGVRSLLEALGVLGQLPTPRLFEQLFQRFGAQVPYETFTAREPGSDVEALGQEVADEGTGVAGLDRARLFVALAGGLGFDVRLVGGTPQAAAVARLGRHDVLADVAYPLPVL